MSQLVSASALGQSQDSAADELLRMKYKGPWTLGPYAVNDVVANNNKLYVCTAVVSSSSPVIGTSAASGTAINFHVPLPTGSLAGDLCVMAMETFAGTTAAVTGFTAIGTDTVSTNTHGQMWTKALSSTDITNGFIVVSNASGQNQACAIIIIRGGTVDTTNAAATGLVTPSVTPTGPGYLVQWVANSAGTGTTFTQASETSVVTSATGVGSVALGYEPYISGSGASAARTWTTSASTTPVSGVVPVLVSMSFPTTSFAAMAAQQGYVDDQDTNKPSYAPSGLKNRFDGLRGVYNWKASNTRVLDQGLSYAAVNGMTRHLVFGDSVSAGCTSAIGVLTFDRLRAWPLAMRDQLAEIGIPSNGTGFVRANDNANVEARYSGTTGVWDNTQLFYIITTTLNSATTFTADRSGSILDTLYYDGANGTFTISVNGATSGTGFATVVGSGVGTWKKFRMSGQAIVPGSTVTIKCTVVNTTGVYFAGFAVFSPNQGLIVDNVSQSGAKATGTGITSWSDASAGPYAAYKDIAGRTRQVLTGATTAGSPTLTATGANFTTNDIGEPIDLVPDATGIAFPPGSYISAFTSATVVTISANALITSTARTVNIGRDPACIHIALGGNDIQGASTDAQIMAAITTIRNLYPKSDCILHLQNEIAPALASSARELSFQQAIYNLADTLDVPLYDWRDRTGPYATALANGVYGDYQAHMVSAMYANLGASLAVIMGGGSARPQASSPVLPTDLANKGYVDSSKMLAKLSTSVVSTAATDTMILQYQVPANSVAVGSSFEFTLFGLSSSTGTLIFKVHAGAAGTVADGVAWTSITSAAQVANQRAGINGVLTVRSIGSGTCMCEAQGYAQAALLPTVVATAATAAITTTAPWWITLSVTASVGTFTGLTGIITAI
jgi:hypothetical protein